jgi:chorismate-pyruvate lyase
MVSSQDLALFLPCEHCTSGLLRLKRSPLPFVLLRAFDVVLVFRVSHLVLSTKRRRLIKLLDDAAAPLGEAFSPQKKEALKTSKVEAPESKTATRSKAKVKAEPSVHFVYFRLHYLLLNPYAGKATNGQAFPS